MRINPRTLGKALANKRLVSAQLLGAFNERRQAHFFPWFGRVVQQEHLQRLRTLVERQAGGLSVHTPAELRLGGDKGDVVRIERTDGTRRN